MAKRKLRGGLVGGGPGSFIGPVHRMAATMDGEAEYVAGALDIDPAKSKKAGKVYYMDPKRVYGTWREMVKKEAALPKNERIDFVTIVTPNVAHFEIAKAFLEAGFSVMCEKPMTMDLASAKALRKIVNKSKQAFVINHNYTGYPMVKQAKHMIAKGKLGKLNKIIVEYPQGWLSGYLRGEASAIRPWRMDPKMAGAACCMGDIGTHAENLVRYITGLSIRELCADLSSFIPGNKLDDDGNVLVHWEKNVKGTLCASQISSGEENGVNIRVYGTKLGIQWFQEDPNYLYVKDPSGFQQVLSRGNPAVLCDAANKSSRLPFGHPDGFIEAVANLYLEFYKDVRAVLGGKPMPKKSDHPTVTDGVIGMAFIETVLASNKSKSKWTKMRT
jgi:predicted dehydrogenase